MNKCIGRFLMRRYRKKLRTTLAGLLALVTVGIFSPTVFADNWPLDNTDPVSTGCANSGVTKFSRNVDGGVLDLRFSTNPNCYTAWARFTDNDPNGYTNFTLWVNRLPDTQQDLLYVTFPYYVNPGGQIWSYQLWDGALTRCMRVTRTTTVDRC